MLLQIAAMSDGSVITREVRLEYNSNFSKESKRLIREWGKFAKYHALLNGLEVVETDSIYI